MNTSLRLFVAILLLWPSAAFCQSPLPPEAAKINYVAHIPSQVMKIRPKGAATRFFGIAKIRGQTLALHLYALGSGHTIDKRTLGSKNRMDIFTLSKLRKQTQYKLLLHVVFDSSRPPKHKIMVQMASLWLDPQQKTKPIILARLIYFLNESERTYHDVLFTFANGVSKKPAVNHFSSAHYSKVLGESNVVYSPVDEKGFVTLLATSSSGGDVTMTAYKWNGQRFAEFQKQFDEYEDSIFYDWNGKEFIKTDLAIPTVPNPNG